MVGGQAVSAGEVGPAGIDVAEQPGLGCAPDAAVFGIDRQRKDAGAERAIYRAIGAPRLAVEDGDAVIEGAGPKASGFVYGEGIGVVVAEAVLGGVVGVLLASGCGGVVAPDALIFSTNPDGVVRAGAEGGDKLALCIRVPGGSGSAADR